MPPTAITEGVALELSKSVPALLIVAVIIGIGAALARAFLRALADLIRTAREEREKSQQQFLDHLNGRDAKDEARDREHREVLTANTRAIARATVVMEGLEQDRRDNETLRVKAIAHHARGV